MAKPPKKRTFNKVKTPPKPKKLIRRAYTPISRIDATASAVAKANAKMQRRLTKKMKEPVVVPLAESIVLVSDTAPRLDAGIKDRRGLWFYLIKSRIGILIMLSFLLVYSTLAQLGIKQKHNVYYALTQQAVAQPFNAVTHKQIGEYLEAQNNFNDAKREYHMAMTLGDKSGGDALVRIAHKEAAPQVIAETIIVWEAFVSEHPNYRDGWITLAVLRYQLRDKARALEAAQKALGVDPSYEFTQRLIGTLNK